MGFCTACYKEVFTSTRITQKQQRDIELGGSYFLTCTNINTTAKFLRCLSLFSHISIYFPCLRSRLFIASYTASCSTTSYHTPLVNLHITSHCPKHVSLAIASYKSIRLRFESAGRGIEAVGRRIDSAGRRVETRRRRLLLYFPISSRYHGTRNSPCYPPPVSLCTNLVVIAVRIFFGSGHTPRTAPVPVKLPKLSLRWRS